MKRMRSAERHVLQQTGTRSCDSPNEGNCCVALQPALRQSSLAWHTLEWHRRRVGAGRVRTQCALLLVAANIARRCTAAYQRASEDADCIPVSTSAPAPIRGALPPWPLAQHTFGAHTPGCAHLAPRVRTTRES